MMPARPIEVGALLEIQANGEKNQLYVVGKENGRVFFARNPNGKPRWGLTFEFVKEHGRLISRAEDLKKDAPSVGRPRKNNPNTKRRIEQREQRAERRAELERRRDAGETLQQIADSLGLTRQAVHYALKP